MSDARKIVSNGTAARYIYIVRTAVRSTCHGGRARARRRAADDETERADGERADGERADDERVRSLARRAGLHSANRIGTVCYGGGARRGGEREARRRAGAAASMPVGPIEKRVCGGTHVEHVSDELAALVVAVVCEVGAHRDEEPDDEPRERVELRRRRDDGTTRQPWRRHR